MCLSFQLVSCDYFLALGRLAPYLERRCVRLATPAEARLGERHKPQPVGSTHGHVARGAAHHQSAISGFTSVHRLCLFGWRTAASSDDPCSRQRQLHPGSATSEQRRLRHTDKQLRETAARLHACEKITLGRSPRSEASGGSANKKRFFLQ